MIATFSAVPASQSTVAPQKVSLSAATSLLDANALWTIPPNYLYVGKILRVRALVSITKATATQFTFTFRLYMGSVIIWDSGAIVTTTTVQSATPVDIEVVLKVITTGVTTTATVFGHGRVTSRGIVFSGATADPALTFCTLICPATTPAASTGFDSTISNILDLRAACSAVDTLDGVQCYNFFVEDLG
jgi:hypothetical protein